MKYLHLLDQVLRDLSGGSRVFGLKVIGASDFDIEGVKVSGPGLERSDRG